MKKVTTQTLARLRDQRRPAVFVTAYDYPTATFAEQAGVDMILVGDSLAMTMLGHRSTVRVGMTEMLVFARAVSVACEKSFVVGDMPFLSYQADSGEAVRNAGAFVQAGCDAVKCEGGARMAHRVKSIADAGIAVMGHIGLTPQSLGQMGGYRVQGKSLEATRELAADAIALQQAGAFAILIEAVPAESARYVRRVVDIPVYGIGAGPHTDGQLVISHDILGSFVGEIEPRFVKRYAELGDAIRRVFCNYADDVRSGEFPGPEHCYPIPVTEAELIRRELDATTNRIPVQEEV